ncbi:LOW QUALITY PROTEIN: Tigger transposable element-derived protein 4, partial [Frankliniella fusca]
TVQTWKTAVLPHHLQGYQLRDIYNVDEFGLYFNLLPDKTMCNGNKQAVGNKGAKFRISVLLGSNADGTDKLKPLAIGKSKKPRCFANVRTLPCTYKHQESAWMSTEIFKDFLIKFDNQMRMQRRKVVLFVDNAPTQPPDFKLQHWCFSQNATSKLQPMDQGVIRNVKYHYRVRLVTRLLNFIGRANVQKKDMYVNLLQALHFLVASPSPENSTSLHKMCMKPVVTTAFFFPLRWAWDQVKAETVL